MKIGIDAHFLSKISQGTGTYTFQLVNAINQINKFDELYLLNKRNMQESPLMVNRNVKHGKLISNFTPFNVAWGYHHISHKLNLDIIHTNYLCSILPEKAKQIMTIHDILFKTHPDFFPNKLQNGVNALSYLCLKKTDHIIAVSDYTKEQLIRFYPFTEDKISVIYEAASTDFYYINDKARLNNIIQKKFGIYKPFVLFVGRLAPIKNIEKLLKIFASANLRNTYDLVIVGKFDSSFPNERLKSMINCDGVRRLEGISNEALNILYNAASLFYFVSHGEGFGLPIIEAMSAGCPVLTSNVTACNEIAGDAAVKVSPTSEVEISNALLFLLNNKDCKDELSKKGLEHAQHFTWQRCAEQTLELYHKIHHEI